MTAPIQTSYGTSQYSATAEAHVLSIRRGTELNATKRGCLWCHPNTQHALADGITTFRYIGDALANAGFVTLLTDMGGTLTWGNDTARNRMIDGATYVRTRGASASKDLVIAGASAGAPTGLYWALNNLTDVAAIALIVPTVDMADIYDNNRNGLAASISTAWGTGAAWEAAEPTRNPINYADDLAAIPIGIWYAPDDTTVVPATVTAFAAAHGNTTLTSMGNVGHTLPTSALTEMAAWLAATAAP